MLKSPVDKVGAGAAALAGLHPLDFDPEEITKRFVRGEKARTGEGSGLGLAIAKTYTESCGGQFHIVIEDDCFIAVICLPSITS